MRSFLYMLLTWAGLLTGACFAFSQPTHFRFAQEGIQSLRLPIEIHNNLILVEVRINGSFPMKFILDTGVKTTLLTEPLLTELLTLPNIRPIQVKGLGDGEVIEAFLASGVHIDLEGVAGRNLRLIILPQGAVSYSGMFGMPVFGILGYDFFKDFVVEINYFHRYLRLIAPDRFKPRRRHGEAVPIVLKRSKPYIQAGVVDHTGDTLHTDWLIDTGASQAISIYHEEVDLPPKTLDAFIGRGISGDMFGKIGRVQSFSIGDFTFEDVVAGYPEAASIRWVAIRDSSYANLGAAILSRFTVTFDYPHYKVYLKKNPRYKLPFEYNTCGLEVVADGDMFDKHLISYVRPSSPAEKADVRVGDEILTVNGSNVREMQIGELHNSLNRREGKKLCLKLRREGETLKRCFILESGI